MRGTRVGFGVSLGVATIAACSGANPNDALTLRALGPSLLFACGSTSCPSSQPFCCDTTTPLDGATADGVVHTCVASQSSCAGGVALKQCSTTQNCGTGQVCCRLVAAGVTSQLCELTCPIGESQLCASTSECMPGERCQTEVSAADAATTGACISFADSGGPDDSALPDAGSVSPDARPDGNHGG